jgi:hypothetical protein
MMGRAGIFRALRIGMFFSIVAGGLTVSLTVAPARAADLLTDEKILETLKAKRLTRCPRASTRSRCGGAQLQTLPPKDRVSMSKSFSITGPPLYNGR